MENGYVDTAQRGLKYGQATTEGKCGTEPVSAIEAPLSAQCEEKGRGPPSPHHCQRAHRGAWLGWPWVLKTLWARTCAGRAEA